MKKLVLIILCSAFFMISCKERIPSSKAPSGNSDENTRYKVELLNCQGETIRTWISSSHVRSLTYSDNFRFWDSEDQTEVRISGTIIVTKL